MTPADSQAFTAAVTRGRAQIKAGETVNGDAVSKWVNSWGTDQEIPRPDHHPRPPIVMPASRK